MVQEAGLALLSASTDELSLRILPINWQQHDLCMT